MRTLNWISNVGRRARTSPEVDRGLLSSTISVRRPVGLSAHALLQFATLVIAPLLLTGALLHGLVGNGFAMDFHNQYWPAGRRVLDGLSPYDLAWQDIDNHIAFPYGAIPALLFVPFALLPHGLADALFIALLLATVPLTLRLLGVRDWRVYGIAFLWVPVIAAWMFANVTLLLVLGIALLWRYRDRAFVAGLLVAVLVSTKLFVWPLAIWLLGTRRYAAFGYTALCGLALNLIAWMVIGFDQLVPYVKLLGLVSEHAETHTSTLQWVAVHYGASRWAGHAMMFALAAAVGVAGFVLARRGREQSALLLCIAMSFLASPVTWAHYWALLIVPLALLRPRLSLVWTIPVLIAPVGMVLFSLAGPVAVVIGSNAMIAAVVIAALRPATLDISAPPESQTA